MMRAYDGRVDHLQRGVAYSASRKRLQDHIPDAAICPTPELPKDRIPLTEFLRQVAPRCTGAHQPKHRVEHAAMIARPPAGATDQERFKIRPLIVGHQSANQGCSPQRTALNQFAIPASIDCPRDLISNISPIFNLQSGRPHLIGGWAAAWSAGCAGPETKAAGPKADRDRVDNLLRVHN
jgi:hypothetical protein